MKNIFFKFFLVIGIVGVLGILFSVPTFSVLILRNRKMPAQYFCSRAAAKNGFIISYTHSVNKGRVKDFYFHTPENHLELNKTIFVSYGAGIPEPEETEGAEFKVLENGYEISNLHRVVPRLMMAVGIIANHSITIDDSEYFLTDYFAPQTSLILEIKRISLFNIISNKLKGKTIPRRR